MDEVKDNNHPKILDLLNKLDKGIKQLTMQKQCKYNKQRKENQQLKDNK